VGGSYVAPRHRESRLCDRLGIRQDLVVPESQDAIALRLQPAGTLFVVGDLHRMLATIHVDNHPAFETHKVHDERTNRLLAAKLNRRDLTALELLPKTPFCVRQVLAQFSRAFGIHPPIPAFPHKGGRSVVGLPPQGGRSFVGLPPQGGKSILFSICTCVGTHTKSGRASFWGTGSELDAWLPASQGTSARAAGSRRTALRRSISSVVSTHRNACGLA